MFHSRNPSARGACLLLLLAAGLVVLFTLSVLAWGWTVPVLAAPSPQRPRVHPLLAVPHRDNPPVARVCHRKDAMLPSPDRAADEQAPRLRSSVAFRQAYQRLSPPLQRLVARKIRLLQDNPRHPSLCAHRVVRLPGQDVWECYVNLQLRLLYHQDAHQVLSLWDLGTHKLIETVHQRQFCAHQLTVETRF